MSPPPPDSLLGVELLGVYDADAGVRGEAAYILGKLLRRRHCGLCDITHSGVRRKRSWDELVADLRADPGVQLRVAHLNELSAEESAVARSAGAPVVLARGGDGLRVVLDRAQLDSADGDVDRFAVLLRDALAA